MIVPKLKNVLRDRIENLAYFYEFYGGEFRKIAPFECARCNRVKPSLLLIPTNKGEGVAHSPDTSLWYVFFFF